MNNNLEFKNFYNQNFKLLYFFLRKRLPQAQDAEDVCAESFAAIWENWSNVKTESAKSLLFAICKNKLNSYFRKQYGVNAHFSLLTEEQVETLPAKLEEADVKSNSNSLVALLSNLVSKLSGDEQQLYDLKYKQNKSYTQLAQIMNITVDNAKVKNNRLVKKLKQIWEQQVQTI